MLWKMKISNIDPQINGNDSYHIKCWSHHSRACLLTESLKFTLNRRNSGGLYFIKSMFFFTSIQSDFWAVKNKIKKRRQKVLLRMALVNNWGIMT